MEEQNTQPKRKKPNIPLRIILFVLLLIGVFVLVYYLEGDFKKKIDEGLSCSNPETNDTELNQTEKLSLAYQLGASDMKEFMIFKLINSSINCEIIPISYLTSNGVRINKELIAVDCLGY